MMIEEHYHEERWLFRFIDLDRDHVDKLYGDWGADLKVSDYKDTNKFVAILELEDGKDYQAVVDFLEKYELAEDSYGLYISLVTEADMDGVHVPHFVSELFRMTGGTIDFSFTSV